MLQKADSQSVRVEVESSFLPEHSDLQAPRYVFAYHVKITNLSDTTVQLLSRHWIITDGLGRTEEVRGPGVIGQQPKLGAGESFEYESFCPLPTPTGMMRGSYQMTSEDGARFEVLIPEFDLADPSAFH